MPFDDQKPKLEINEAVRVVAGFLNTRGVWTDGYSDSAAETWDGIVKLYKKDSELKGAIISLESTLKPGSTSDEMKSLGLTGNLGQYLEMLSHMKGYC